MTFTQDIQFTILLWLTFTLLTLISLRGVDKNYRLKYFWTNVYKLGKIKVLFSFYDRKKGEIAKYVFWLNIIFHIINIAFLTTFIAYVILQTNLLKILNGAFILSYVGLWIATSGFNFYYDNTNGKKTK